MDLIWEKAREVGRLLSQTDEYKALKRADARMGEEREVVTALNRLQQLEEQLTVALRQGEEPAPEVVQEYERVGQQVQGSAVYQSLAAAHANFDRLTERMQQEIARGMQAGEQSRIILPS